MNKNQVKIYYFFVLFFSGNCFDKNIFFYEVTPGYTVGNDPVTAHLNHFSISFELQSSLNNDNGSDETNREEEYWGEVSPIPVEHETREKQQTTYRWCQEAETVSSGDRGST